MPARALRIMSLDLVLATIPFLKTDLYHINGRLTAHQRALDEAEKELLQVRSTVLSVIEKTRQPELFPSFPA